MPWSNSRPGSNPKYATREHRTRRAALVEAIRKGDQVECCEDVCLFASRLITNINGHDRDGLNLAHWPDGVTYRGASHRACNLHDGSVRGNRRSRGVSEPESRWVL